MFNDFEHYWEDGYYDLIELPGKGHIPVPIAFHLLKAWGYDSPRILAQIPRSRQWRDGQFFRCPICGEPSFYRGNCSECWYDEEMLGADETYHRRIAAQRRTERLARLRNNEIKERVFRQFILQRKLRQLRYVRSVRERGFWERR